MKKKELSCSECENRTGAGKTNRSERITQESGREEVNRK